MHLIWACWWIWSRHKWQNLKWTYSSFVSLILDNFPTHLKCAYLYVAGTNAWAFMIAYLWRRHKCQFFKCACSSLAHRHKCHIQMCLFNCSRHKCAWAYMIAFLWRKNKCQIFKCAYLSLVDRRKSQIQIKCSRLS